MEAKKEMDYWAAIKDLNLEKQRLDKAIATLEALYKSEVAKAVSRRGRKTMPEAERQIVSERMKRYWAARKKTPD